MAAKRSAHPRRIFRRRPFAPTPAGMAAMLAAQAALYGDGDPITGVDALALREQLRVEDELRTSRQGELRLVMKGSG